MAHASSRSSVHACVRTARSHSHGRRSALSSIVAFAIGGAPTTFSKCIIRLCLRQGGAVGLSPGVKYHTPFSSSILSPSLWHMLTQQPPFHCENDLSPTYSVSDCFFIFQWKVCGPSKQQQLRHGHGDP